MCLLAATAGFYAAQPTLSAVEDQTAIDRTREDFELMRLFAEAYEQIDLSYVNDVDRRDQPRLVEVYFVLLVFFIPHAMPRNTPLRRQHPVGV